MISLVEHLSLEVQWINFKLKIIQIIFCLNIEKNLICVQALELQKFEKLNQYFKQESRTEFLSKLFSLKLINLNKFQWFETTRRLPDVSTVSRHLSLEIRLEHYATLQVMLVSISLHYYYQGGSIQWIAMGPIVLVHESAEPTKAHFMAMVFVVTKISSLLNANKIKRHYNIDRLFKSKAVIFKLIQIDSKRISPASSCSASSENGCFKFPMETYSLIRLSAY